MSKTTTLEVYRGDSSGGRLKSYEVETYPGMVVLDAIHDIQAKQEPTLAVRWNCKAGRCGSCSAEINGKPTAGVIKDTVVVPTYGRASVDFTADQPGLTLFHCHIQAHMDFGF